MMDDLVALVNEASDEELLESLKTALASRAEVLQDLVDWAVPEYAYGSARPLMDARCSGVVKSFNAKNGYGFITSPDITKAFGMDLFVSDKQLNGLAPGTEVTFAILLNKKKPHAFDVLPAHTPVTIPQIALGGKGGGKGMKGKNYAAVQTEYDMNYQMVAQQRQWQPEPAPVANFYTSSGKGGKSSKGDNGNVVQGAAVNNPDWQQATITSAVEMPGVTDRRFTGNVKSMKEGKFGFLTSFELQQIDPQDIFVHWTLLEGYSIGDEVSFAVVINEKGGFKAVDLRSASNEPPTKRPRQQPRPLPAY